MLKMYKGHALFNFQLFYEITRSRCPRDECWQFAVYAPNIIFKALRTLKAAQKMW